METVAFVYNGSNRVDAHIYDAVIGKEYQLVTSYGTPLTAFADSATFVMTVTDIFDPTPAVTFPCEVTSVATGEFYGNVVFSYGTAGEYVFSASWSYDGVNTVECEATFDLGVNYTIFAAGPFGFADLGGLTGTGALQTLTLNSMDPPYLTPIAGSVGQFEAGVYDADNNAKTERLFVPDVAGDGKPGNVYLRRVIPSAPLWRFLLTALDGTGITDLSKITSDRVCEVVLNAPLTLGGTVPSDNPQVWIPYDDAYDDPYLEEGTRFLFGFRRESESPPYYTVRASTIVKLINDEAQQDDARTAFQGRDPWDYMFSRPVCNFDGSLPGPDGIQFTDTQVATVIEVLLNNTFQNQGHTFIDVPDLMPNGDVNGQASGFWTGTIETATAMKVGVPPDPPYVIAQNTSVGQAWQQLCALGICDIVLKPIYDPVNRPNYLVELNVYEEAGVTNDAAIFAWNLPGRSLVGLSRQQDGAQRANEVLFYAGPGGSVGAAPAQVDAASEAKFGVYTAQQFWPGQTTVPAVTSLAQEQLRLRKNGQQTVTFRPAPERSPRPWIDYDLGDRVPVWASPQGFRKLLG